MGEVKAAAQLLAKGGPLWPKERLSGVLWGQGVAQLRDSP